MSRLNIAKMIAVFLICALLLWGVTGSQVTFTLGTTPGNPSAGKVRIWANSGSGNVECLTSSGGSCFPTSGISGLTVNGSGTGTNLSDSTPSATAGYVNSKWQISSSNMSSEILQSAQGAAFSIGTCTTAATIDPANGAVQTMLLTAADACVITITQPGSGTSIVRVRIKQASTPTGTVTWPACVLGTSGSCWPGGIVPVMTGTASAYDWYSCMLDGTNAWCTASQNFQ